MSKINIILHVYIYLSALKADSVSIYNTAPSSPPFNFGNVHITLSIILNWVLPHPDGPAIYTKQDLILNHEYLLHHDHSTNNGRVHCCKPHH